MTDKFTSNSDELRKIINENIWFGSENRDIALEFLDAIIQNHQDEINNIKSNIVQVVQEDPEEDIEYYNPEDYTEADYGLGKLIYCDINMNLRFQYAFENFIQKFKVNS